MKIFCIKNINRIILLFMFMYAQNVYANVVFNEIAWMGTSTSSGNEWIELYNNGNSSVDFSGWSIMSGDNNLSFNLSGSISAGGFYLIERTDDTTLSSITADLVANFGYGLSNSGETLILKNNLGESVNTLSFSSGWPAGDNDTNQTMQLIGSNWITADPTPKSATVGVPSGTQSSPSSSSGSSVTVQTQVPVKPKEIPIPKITTKIIVKDTVIAGIDVPIEVNATGLSGGKLEVGKFVWNFGDGTPVIERANSAPFIHRYKYPGEYLITLNFMEYSYRTKPDATDRIVMTVTSGDIFISSIGDELDTFVELENKTKHEVVLSKWILKSNNEVYIIPDGTVILPGKKLKLSGEANGFSGINFNSVELLQPSGNIAYVFPVANTTVTHNTNTGRVYASSYGKINSVSDTIDLNNIHTPQSAEASSSGMSVPVSVTILIVLIGAGIVTALFFINKKSSKIDDLELSSNDIRIIE